MNASLIVNPAAGNKAYRSIYHIETLIRKKASLTTFITQKKGDAFQFAKDLSGSDLIIVAGGDGTFNEVINGLHSSSGGSRHDVPLAFIPLGTTNVLAKELRIPERVDKAVELALTGTPRKISLGRINGWCFASMAGIGFDAETVLRVKNNLVKKISGKAAHVTAGLRVLSSYDPPLIRIKSSEKEFSGYTVVIGNNSNYGGYFSVTPDASITEPLLDVCVYSGRTRKDLLRFILGVIRERHLHFSDVVYFKTTALDVSSSGTVHVQVDGDYLGTLPVKVDVVKDAVNLIWPSDNHYPVL
ncbi:MAG: diacylglycerol kinase family lipid kinase [Nitrospiraceae bacterium]|nr:MAG: diacylglycerol kinase family lipid kinase [Nitrospiraceae bacterium]